MPVQESETVFLDQELQEALILGRGDHEWWFLGKKVIYTLYASVTERDIAIKASGLDAYARRILIDMLEVAHALVSFGRYTFKNPQESLRFFESLQPPVKDIFVHELRDARNKQISYINSKLEELKKPPRTQS